MPRTRRRHHSRSRSRSRSHSHDRDRDAKRRKVESFDSLHNRRSVSSEPEANEIVENAQNDSVGENVNAHSTTTSTSTSITSTSITEEANSATIQTDQAAQEVMETDKVDDQVNVRVDDQVNDKIDQVNATVDDQVNDKIDDKFGDEVLVDDKVEDKVEDNTDGVDEEALDTTQGSEVVSIDDDDEDDDVPSDPEVADSSSNTNADGANISITTVVQNLLKITPQKALTPKQVQKKLESEKKKQERQQEKDERERKRQEERDERKRQKDAKDAKAKEEREAKQRDKELKEREREQKRKEREEKEEVKRKEKEAERLKRQAEIDEKQREKLKAEEKKLKAEEKKLKAAAAFTKFFVPKQKCAGDGKEETISANFMPFQLKSDMRLAPTTRNNLSREDKENLDKCLLEHVEEATTYLKELKTEFMIRKTGKTWTNEDGDVTIVEDLGESIMKASTTSRRMKAKYLKFHANRRPGYYGTWRKRSKTISGRTPLCQDGIFNYEVDSDEEWEDEEDGEDIAGSDDEEKEPDSENDYEVDDEFFVPHGHLSEDEENDDEENISPEMRKAKEKLLKNQFDEERKSKTQKLKPRVIGCIWYNDEHNVDAAIHKFLQPYSIIANGIINIKKRSDMVELNAKHKWQLDKELMPELLRLVHGNVNSKKLLVAEFYEHLSKNNINVAVNKFGLAKLIKRIATKAKCLEEGAMFRKWCWLLNDETKKEFNHIKITLPNQWQYCSSHFLKGESAKPEM